MYKSFIIATAIYFFSLSNAFACYLKGEEVDGMNKICYYDCLSGTKAITISSIALCPLNIMYEKYEKDTKEFIIKEAKNICLIPSEKIYCSNNKSKIFNISYINN